MSISYDEALQNEKDEIMEEFGLTEEDYQDYLLAKEEGWQVELNYYR